MEQDPWPIYTAMRLRAAKAFPSVAEEFAADDISNDISNLILSALDSATIGEDLPDFSQEEADLAVWNDLQETISILREVQDQFRG